MKRRNNWVGCRRVCSALYLTSNSGGKNRKKSVININDTMACSCDSEGGGETWS